MSPRSAAVPATAVRRSVLAVALLVSVTLVLVAAPAQAHPEEDPEDGKASATLDLEPVVSEPLSGLPCEDGTAGVFPCDGVDLESFVPLAELGGGTGNDVWGWTDPQTGREYALMGTSNGTAFVDVTDARNPVVVGHMPTQSAVLFPLWRDIKVYRDHAFVVSEHDGHGMQVFDLTRLRATVTTPAVFTPDVVYDRFSNAHNIWVNADTGYAYAVGTNTCAGGLHMIDVSSPQQPAFAGCFSDDGYTHDVECVVYHGPDARFRGREICFAANEDTVTVVDVTDKRRPAMLSRTGYATARYTHQGSLTPDHGWFLFGDELDEQSGTVPNTTTYIMRAAKLTSPSTPVPFLHDTHSIDHNLYVRGPRVYESNYTAGLRILEYDRKSLRAAQLTEVAYFDVVPGVDAPEFAGTWSNYRFPGSGVVVVSTLESGLFVLRPRAAGEQAAQREPARVALAGLVL